MKGGNFIRKCSLDSCRVFGILNSVYIENYEV